MKKTNPLAFINPIRIILILSILLLHIPFGFDVYRSGFDGVVWGFREIAHYGGNYAFLLISGMMFYIAYYKKLISGELKIGQFLLKRVLLIVPAVFVTVLVAYSFHLIGYFSGNTDINISVVDLLLDLFFFGKRYFGGDFGTYNPPIWFLSTLFVSYSIACFIIWVTRKKSSLLWLLIPLILFGCASFGGDIPLFILKRGASECFSFFVGIFFMFFLTKFVTFKKYVTIPVRISLGLIAFGYVFVYYYFINNLFDLYSFLGNLLFWMPLFTILYGSPITIAFDNKVFKVLAGSSLYIYLWHHPLNIVQYNICNWFGWPVLTEGYVHMFIFVSIVVAISIAHYYIHKALFKKTEVIFRPKEVK